MPVVVVAGLGLVLVGCGGDRDRDGRRGCDDADPAVGGAEVPYDGVDNDCDPATRDDDLDLDGRPLSDDCDDTDPLRGGEERPYDGVDQDCDPATPDDDLDRDGLPYHADCDDADAAVTTDVVRIGDLTEADLPDLCDPEWCNLTVDGDLDLVHTTLEDLEDLRCVVAVEGSVSIQGAALTSLAGLRSLTRVGGALRLGDGDPWDYGVPSLGSLEGLDALGSVGGDLFLQGPSGLTSLAGLGGLVSVGGRLWVDRHPELVSLAGLERLESLGAGFPHEGASLVVDGNAALVSLAGLESLVVVDGGIEITSNDRLGSIEALGGVQAVEDVVVVEGNGSLGSLEGLHGLTSAPGVSLARNGLTSLDGLRSLGSVGERGFYVWSEPQLSSLSGLDALETVDGAFEVGAAYGPASLASVDGAERLRSVGALSIAWCEELADVTGLYGLTTVVGDVLITGNVQLGDAAAQALVDQIESIGGSVIVSGN